MPNEHNNMKVNLKTNKKTVGKGEPLKFLREDMMDDPYLEQRSMGIYLQLLDKTALPFSSDVGVEVLARYMKPQLDRIYRNFSTILYLNDGPSEITLEKRAVSLSYPISQGGNVNNLEGIRLLIDQEIFTNDLPELYNEIILEPNNRLNKSLEKLSFIDNPPVVEVW